MDDKSTLAKTAVGRRVIAYMTITNSADYKRLRQFITEGFTPNTLGEWSVGERIRWHKELFQVTGKLRVHQVMASDDHHVVLVLQAQADGTLYLVDVRVMDDFPHKISDFSFHPFIEEIT